MNMLYLEIGSQFLEYSLMSGTLPRRKFLRYLIVVLCLTVQRGSYHELDGKFILGSAPKFQCFYVDMMPQLSKYSVKVLAAASLNIFWWFRDFRQIIIRLSLKVAAKDATYG